MSTGIELLGGEEFETVEAPAAVSPELSANSLQMLLYR
jgi:hypothetical protein